MVEGPKSWSSQKGSFLSLLPCRVEDPDGTVWVLDALNFRVQHLDGGLHHLGHFGTHGDGSGHLALPRGLTIDFDGHLYVSDAQFDLIQLFDSDGRLLLTVGARGNGPGEFWSPAGIACDDRGTLVVADAGNGRVQILKYGRRGSGS
ncbi:MAG: 6-bladed beta-propeller [Acidobacteriota bacterium]